MKFKKYFQAKKHQVKEFIYLTDYKKYITLFDVKFKNYGGHHHEAYHYEGYRKLEGNIIYGKIHSELLPYLALCNNPSHSCLFSADRNTLYYFIDGDIFKYSPSYTLATNKIIDTYSDISISYSPLGYKLYSKRINWLIVKILKFRIKYEI